MKYPMLLAAAAAAGLAVPAQAQDLSGFRVEARAAWEQVGVDATLPNPDDDEDEQGDEFLTGSDHDSGIAYGAELGFDAQVGSGLVLGAYAGVDFSDGTICAQLVEDDLACAGLERTFTLGARAGVPLGRTSLAYLKGGYSNGKFDAAYDADVTDNDQADPGEIFEFSQSQGGYHLGGGLELGLMQGFYAKLEYLYTDFGDRSFALGDADDPALEVGSDRHQVFAGIGLRF